MTSTLLVVRAKRTMDNNFVHWFRYFRLTSVSKDRRKMPPASVLLKITWSSLDGTTLSLPSLIYLLLPTPRAIYLSHWLHHCFTQLHFGHPQTFPHFARPATAMAWLWKTTQLAVSLHQHRAGAPRKQY